MPEAVKHDCRCGKDGKVIVVSDTLDRLKSDIRLFKNFLDQPPSCSKDEQQRSPRVLEHLGNLGKRGAP